MATMASMLAGMNGLDDDSLRLRSQCEQRLADLKNDRDPFEADWRDITTYILPQRGRYMVQTQSRRPRRGSKILDPTATKAHQKLAAFLMAGITNPSINWFRLGLSDDGLNEDPDVKGYLSECQKRMFRVLSSSTFYTSLHQVYEEISGFGTGSMLCLQDYQDVVRFYPLTAGEYWIALNARQEVDTLYREYALTTSQLVQEFGLDRCSPPVQQAYARKQLSAMWVVVHAIEPNRDHMPGLAGPRGAPFAGLYFERNASGGFLRREGHMHAPFIAPRWHALSNDAYGEGPAAQAIADTKSLQAGRRQLAEAAEKLVNPPLQGDARYQQSYLGMLPGDINWLSGLENHANAGLRPVFTVPPNVAVLQAEVQGFQQTIKETFFNDLILAISQMEGVQPRNQMEINERRQEKMLMLGPMLERFFSEALGPVIRIVFDIMQRGGLLPSPPAALHGQQVEPSFISVLAQAQKAVGTTSVEQFVRFVGSMAAVWPGVVQNVNSDEIVTQYAADLEVSPKLIVPAREVKAQRDAMQQQAAQQQALANGQQLAQGAETLSNTDIGGGRNALAAMTGQA